MRRPDTPCAGCGKLLYSSPSSLPAGQRMCNACRSAQPKPPRLCELPGCQVMYVPAPRGNGKPQRFCSLSCKGRAQRIAAGARARLARACEVCGKQYDASYREQRTCGRDCGEELRRRTGTLREQKQWPSCPVYIRDCGWCGTLFAGRHRRARACSLDHSRRLNWAESNQARRVARRVLEHECPCGATIQPHRNKCDACLLETKREHKRKERARKRESIASEPYTLAEIAARDQYRCGICIAEGRTRQARVAMTEAVPHPKAPTIDHVIPWSISRDDTRANVQLAHFLCNSRKHTGGSQQLALVG